MWNAWLYKRKCYVYFDEECLIAILFFYFFHFLQLRTHLLSLNRNLPVTLD